MIHGIMNLGFNESVIHLWWIMIHMNLWFMESPIPWINDSRNHGFMWITWINDSWNHAAVLLCSYAATVPVGRGRHDFDRSWIWGRTGSSPAGQVGCGKTAAASSSLRNYIVGGNPHNMHIVGVPPHNIIPQTAACSSSLPAPHLAGWWRAGSPSDSTSVEVVPPTTHRDGSSVAAKQHRCMIPWIIDSCDSHESMIPRIIDSRNRRFHESQIHMNHDSSKMNHWFIESKIHDSMNHDSMIHWFLESMNPWFIWIKIPWFIRIIDSSKMNHRFIL